MLCKYYRNCENYDDNGYNCNYIQPDLDCYKPKYKQKFSFLNIFKYRKVVK